MNLNLKCDSETKQLQFFSIKQIPKDIMDYDLIEAYLKYLEVFYGKE